MGRVPVKDAVRAERAAPARTTVQFDAEIIGEIDAQAEREATTRAALTRKAVRFYLDAANDQQAEVKVVTLASRRTS